MTFFTMNTNHISFEPSHVPFFTIVYLPSKRYAVEIKNHSKQIMKRECQKYGRNIDKLTAMSHFELLNSKQRNEMSNISYLNQMLLLLKI